MGWNEPVPDEPLGKRPSRIRRAVTAIRPDGYSWESKSGFMARYPASASGVAV